MTARAAALIVFVAGALTLGAMPAFASLAGEVATGRAVAARIQDGTATCNKLRDADFEHLGEYVMDRMVGSRAVHRAMNRRMEAMMGSEYADRMHEALGRRFAGCATDGTTPGPGMMGGAGMMGGGSGQGSGPGAMMGSAGFAWMRNGRWQHMSRADWQRASRDVMGPGMMSGPRDGWSTGAVLAAVVGGLLLGSLVVLATLRFARRRPPAPPAEAQ